MSSFVQVYSITAGGSFKMPYNGFIAVEIREDSNGVLRKRSIDNTGIETWEVA